MKRRDYLRWHFMGWLGLSVANLQRCAGLGAHFVRPQAPKPLLKLALLMLLIATAAGCAVRPYRAYPSCKVPCRYCLPAPLPFCLHEECPCFVHVPPAETP